MAANEIFEENLGKTASMGCEPPSNSLPGKSKNLGPNLGNFTMTKERDGSSIDIEEDDDADAEAEGNGAKKTGPFFGRPTSEASHECSSLAGYPSKGPHTHPVRQQHCGEDFRTGMLELPTKCFLGKRSESEV